MNRETGEIKRLLELEKLGEEERKKYMLMLLDPTKAQMARRPPRVGRNDPCPCGSGKKFKKCCLITTKVV